MIKNITLPLQVVHLFSNIHPMWLQSFAPKSTTSRSRSNQMWQSFARKDGQGSGLCPCQYRSCFDKDYHFHHQVIYNNPQLLQTSYLSRRTVLTNTREMLVARFLTFCWSRRGKKTPNIKHHVIFGPYCRLTLAQKVELWMSWQNNHLHSDANAKEFIQKSSWIISLC